MTDRINALTVILDKDYRDDDIKTITEAVGMIKGVLKVKKHVADSLSQQTAEIRLKTKLFEEICKLLGY